MKIWLLKHLKMQNDKIYSDIINTLVRTKTEAILLQDEVDSLIRSIYIVGEGDFTSTLEKNVRAKTAMALSQLFTNNNHEEVLVLLKQKLNDLNYLSLTIAFEPTLEIIGKISVWIRQNVNQTAVLDITVNKNIIGGAIIEYNGHHGNFTLLPQIDSYFTNINVNL